jgi:alkylation response protein AidB-like acyl-CoA dehydrogenase
MNLDFSKEQTMIKNEALKFLKKESPFERVKELEESAEGYDPKVWKKMAELGWMALLFPEAYEGDGGEFLDTALICEALGSMVTPSPFFSTVVQCGLILLEGGTEEQKKTLIPRIIDGDLILSLAQYEEDGSYELSDLCLQAKADADGFLLSGTKLFAVDANIADKMVVVVKTGDTETSLLLVDTNLPGITITKMPTVGMDNNCEVVFDNVAVPKDAVIGELGNAEAVVKKMNLQAAVLKAAEMLGGCKTCIDMATEYAKQRVQYGIPIGGFQAIQHFVANMMIAYDTNINYMYRTVCKVQEGEDFETDAYGLKANVNDAYNFISERALHIHGGIGTTREGNAGLFFRKAKASEFICGDTPTFFEKMFDKLMEKAAA